MIDDGIPSKPRMSFNLIRWILCLERQIVGKCPKGRQLRTEQCRATRKFLTICVLNNLSKLDYFNLIMTDYLI